MTNLNSCIFQGNLVADPELRFTTSGIAICKFRIAVNTGFGERKSVLFLECTAFRKTGEIINEHFKKGKPIVVQGSLKQDNWETKDSGEKRSRIVMDVDKFYFVNSNKPESEEVEEEAPKAF